MRDGCIPNKTGADFCIIMQKYPAGDDVLNIYKLITNKGDELCRFELPFRSSPLFIL